MSAPGTALEHPRVPHVPRVWLGLAPAGFLLVPLLFLQTVVALYVLFKLWPLALEVSQHVQARYWYEDLFWGTRRFSSEQVYLFNVAAAGTLGSAITSALAVDLHPRNQRAADVVHFFARLLVSAALPLLVYSAIRGGILSIGASGSDLNPYGVVAVAGVAGMFSQQLINVLRTKVVTQIRKP